jgi:hypothetical protein
MSDVLPPIEPETSGQVTQLDVGHSDLGLKIAAAVVIGLAVGGFWLFNSRSGNLKSKLKLPFNKFKSLFKSEWTWRLFLVFQVIGLIGITCLAIIDNEWHLFPYANSMNNELNWDFLDSQFWTEYYENWFVTVFIVAPFLVCKAIDWIFAAKKKSSSRDSWKNN